MAKCANVSRWSFYYVWHTGAWHLPHPALFLFLSAVKWGTRICTWRRSRLFWVPWVSGSCWDTALPSSHNSPTIRTLDCCWTMTKRPGLGWDDYHVSQQSRLWTVCFVFFDMSAVLGQTTLHCFSYCVKKHIKRVYGQIKNPVKKTTKNRLSLITERIFKPWVDDT